jgi:hypothetical protein
MRDSDRCDRMVLDWDGGAVGIVGALLNPAMRARSSGG